MRLFTWTTRCAAAATAVALLVGCAAAEPDPQITGAEVAVIAATLDDPGCAWTASSAPTPGAPQLAIVYDATASRPATAFPDPVVADAVEVGKAGGTVVVVTVDGPGAPARTALPRTALLPAEVRDTPRERGVLREGLACVFRAAVASRPTTAGSDVLTAVNTAVDAMGTHGDADRLDVVTDGWTTGGPLRLDSGVDIGDTPVDQLAHAVVDGPGMARLDRLAVAVHGVGGFAGRSAEEADTRWMAELYQRLCVLAGARSCSVDRDGGATLRAGTAGPTDPVTLPQPQPPVSIPEPELRRLSGNAFFAAGSAELRPDTQQELAPIARMLAPGGGYGAEIVGHVASWGSESYRDQLSAARAATIRDSLVALGANPAAMTARGAGSREPLVDDIGPNGGLLPAQAARNRRVDVLLHRVTGA